MHLFIYMHCFLGSTWETYVWFKKLKVSISKIRYNFTKVKWAESAVNWILSNIENNKWNKKFKNQNKLYIS